MGRKIFRKANISNLLIRTRTMVPSDDDQKFTDEEFVRENKEPTRRSTRKAALDTKDKVFARSLNDEE